MKNIKVFIVDDHNLFREGLKLLLTSLDFITEIFEAQNGKELLETVKDKQPDIILMDIEMPEIDGIEATKEVLKIFPDIKIIALSMYSDENYYSRMIDAGAKGFLLKNSNFNDVKKALKDVYKDKNYFSPEILEAIIKNLNKKKYKKKNTDLTKREIEVLYNICKGLSNQEIADFLYISKRTVDKHRENLLSKTQAKNTAGLVIYAIKNKIIEI